MPGGIPKYIRVWDNGGGYTHFCRKCLLFSDGDADGVCKVNQCGHKLIPAGPGSFDRYTVVFTGRFLGRNGRTHYVGMSCHPFHPQGFGQHGDSDEPFDAPKGWSASVGNKAPWGNRDSRRITFQRLPPDCQKLVVQDYMEIWRIGKYQQTELNLEKEDNA